MSRPGFLKFPKDQVTGQLTGHRPQFTGHKSQVTGHNKNTCEFAVSSYLVRIYLLFFSLYSLFIPTNPMMSSYFSTIPSMRFQSP